MTLDFWIDFIGQDEAEKHLKIMEDTNAIFLSDFLGSTINAIAKTYKK